MTDSRPPAIFLMGPTAAGKTDAAIALHERLGCEIISVDSAMVYRGLDIGSAKPGADELARAPHRLIDIRDPADPYSAADFRHDALEQMREITARGKTPLLTGGTMLYYKQLIDGVANLPASNPVIRAQLQEQQAQEGLSALHHRLAEVDAVSAQRIHPNDPQRILRALEVFEASGRTLTDLWAEQQSETFPWQVLSIALAPAERSVLHERIALRFGAMLDEGLIDEVAALKKRSDLNADLPSMKSVGYRQVWEYLEGGFDRQALLARGIIATRQLAKRQLTWLRRWNDLHWVDTLSPRALDNVLMLVEKSRL
ncbi:MAG: tRNA (adenosine(37)-N6)-dimethylallyltransferase MiaA [Halomonas sp.]|nr:tRNA (adenosine(37)-N6)-dimethylallyltransferase MiaA [Halomonas sp.]MDN6297100.1 tRNA (adenosine(37)-N6)-dimethylallyltransferase MiaA [Halomonas sp.]MDN6313904.1 tRNA (adenosine(37)-N6)-dimethylallyltransferase MiaA [Halomonas sp.]MDN6335553.1 tRNA (adenosine(37)-N6)-dimethylallyltransferase MiaA [Halomonas sp.]